MRLMRNCVPRANALVVAVLVVSMLAACAGDRTADIQQAEAIIDLGDAVNDLRLQASDLQARVDSLAQVVSRQDTVIRQLSNLAGVALPR